MWSLRSGDENTPRRAESSNWRASVRTTRADEIRQLVVKTFAGYPVPLTHKSILSGIDWPEELTKGVKDFSSTVSAALGWWASSGTIVSGHKLRVTTRSGSNRKYILEALSVPEPMLEQKKQPKQQELYVVPPTPLLEVIRKLQNGKLLLEDGNGVLWIATRLESL
jgi:hypothetical protein